MRGGVGVVWVEVGGVVWEVGVVVDPFAGALESTAPSPPSPPALVASASPPPPPALAAV